MKMVEYFGSNLYSNIIFIFRHGDENYIYPQEINYKANIYTS